MGTKSWKGISPTRENPEMRPRFFNRSYLLITLIRSVLISLYPVNLLALFDLLFVIFTCLKVLPVLLTF